jgi:hypothetical protein
MITIRSEYRIRYKTLSGQHGIVYGRSPQGVKKFMAIQNLVNPNIWILEERVIDVWEPIELSQPQVLDILGVYE